MKMIRDYFSYEHFYVIYCRELIYLEETAFVNAACMCIYIYICVCMYIYINHIFGVYMGVEMCPVRRNPRKCFEALSGSWTLTTTSS